MLSGKSWNLGFLFLALYLILVGATAFVSVAIPSALVSLLALLAGVFLLLGK